MHALNFPVESAPGAKNIRDACLHRRPKLPQPLALGVGAAKHILLDRLVLADALQLFRTGLGVSLGDGHSHAGILPSPDGDLSNKRNFVSLGCNSLEIERISRRASFQTDAGNRVPGTGRWIVSKGNVVLHPLRGEPRQARGRSDLKYHWSSIH